jgi:hypothetical protein
MDENDGLDIPPRPTSARDASREATREWLKAKMAQPPWHEEPRPAREARLWIAVGSAVVAILAALGYLELRAVEDHVMACGGEMWLDANGEATRYVLDCSKSEMVVHRP